ncbi:hypothetical protein Ancab_033172 [Ancistrocladus abbreviatus]
MAGGGAPGGVNGEAWKANAGLVLVQLLACGYHVMTEVALNVGINQIVFCDIGNQLLFLFGLSYTNPTYAAAIRPSIPVFTFLLAASMGTVNLLRIEGQMKVASTLACVFGAMLMVVFKGPAVIGDKESELALHGEISAKGQPDPVGWLVARFMEFGLEQWHLGVICPIGNCMCVA